MRGRVSRSWAARRRTSAWEDRSAVNACTWDPVPSRISSARILGAGLVSADDRDGGPELCQAEGGRPADAAAATGDDDGSSGP